jgi:hypothetical protein
VYAISVVALSHSTTESIAAAVAAEQTRYLSVEGADTLSLPAFQ